MYDASNRKDIRKAEKDARQAEINQLEYLKAAMSVSQGRAWFYDLLEFCGCFRCDPTFESNKDYFLDGMRNVGLRIFTDITTHCSDDYILMQKEAYGRRTRNDTASRNPDTDPDATAAERSSLEDDGRDDSGSADSTFDDIYNRALSE